MLPTLPTRTDVLVIGAGPVGLSTAVSLVARGRDVTIVDQQAEGANTSRASVVYSRTLELLDPYGVAEQLVARGIHAPRFTIRDRDKVLMIISFDRLATAFPYTLLVSQAVTEAVLLQRLRELGGQVQRPFTLTALAQDDQAVTAIFSSGEQIRAQYLVGADGMHSTVREQAHIGLRAGGSGTSYTLADVHLSGGVPHNEVAVYFSPAGQLVTVPFPDGSFKVVAQVSEAPHEPEASFVQGLLDTRGPNIEHAVVHDVIWGSRFRIHHGVADRYRAGRVVLAGDAAHDNSPLGGQGMNTGIGDAIALGAALDAALARDTDGTLDVYNETRRQVAKQVVTLTNLLTWLATMDRQVRTLRNVALGGLNPIVSRRLARQLSGLVYC